MEIIKVSTWEKLADTLTKYVNKDAVGKHMKGAASRFEEGRHELMPECDAGENDEWGWNDEGDEMNEQERNEEENEERILWMC